MARRCTVLLLGLLATPAMGGQILYATSAIRDRLDAFCVRPNGGLEPEPAFSVDTVENPRRLVVREWTDATGTARGALYVAGKSSTQVFAIDPRGRLKPLGRTAAVSRASPRDLGIYPASGQPRMLYMPHRYQDRIAAYPLDSATGGFVDEGTAEYTTCIKGPFGVGWEDLEVVDDRLYATGADGRGRVVVYPIAPDGALPEDVAASPGACRAFSDVVTTMLSERTCLEGAGALVVLGDGTGDPPWILYVAAIYRGRILAFHLASDGLFTPAVPIGSGACKKLEQDKAESKTKRIGRLIDLVVATRTLADGTVLRTMLAPTFRGGRAFAFSLVDDGAGPLELPRRPTKQTTKSLKRSPVRGWVAEAAEVDQNGDPLLTFYLSGGALDRVETYRLKTNSKGTRLLPTGDFVSRTFEQRRTFPNDVVVVPVPDGCNG